MSRLFRDQLELAWPGDEPEVEPRPRLAPGKRALTQVLPAAPRSADDLAARRAHVAAAWGAAMDGEDVSAAAAHGVAGAGAPLPYLDTIQRAFGPAHDLSGVRAHTDARASGAARTIGARAYATGSDIAFDGVPDLHTAAHEAAHVVQQRAGVHLAGGVGSAGDPYELHADAVADAVVRGESAAALLAATPSGGSSSTAVQCKERTASAVIIGHASPRWESTRGRDRAMLNQELSALRAEQVRRELVRMFREAEAAKGNPNSTQLACTVQCAVEPLAPVVSANGHRTTEAETLDPQANGAELRRVEVVVTLVRKARGTATTSKTGWETTPKQCKPNRTRDWAVKVKASTGIMVGVLGGGMAHLRIQNRLTMQEADFLLPMAGGGLGIGTSGGADAGWSDWSEFETLIPVTFDDFHKTFAEIAGASVSVIGSAAVKSLRIPRLGVQGVNISGIGVGGIGIEASHQAGLLLASGDLPDAECVGPTRNKVTTTTTDDYEYDMPTSHHHVVRFSTQSHDLTEAEETRLREFTDALVETYDSPVE